MGWSDDDYDYDDNDDERGRAEPRGGKRRKQYEQDESSNDYRQKRSGKRFHRRKTIKDESWLDDVPRSQTRGR